MKKNKIATIVMLIVGATTGICADVTVTGQSIRTSITPTSPSDNLILDSTIKGEYRVDQPTTFKSVYAKSGTGLGNIDIMGQGGFTIDINSNSGNVDALTANKLSMFYHNMTISNTAINSTAVANINVSTIDIKTLSSDYQQSQTLTFDSVIANVNATTTTIGNDNKPNPERTTEPHEASINIDNYANVTWNGNINLVGYGMINLTGQGNFVQNGDVSLGAKTANNAGGTINIYGGSTYTIKSGAITMNKGSNLNIFGTLATSSSLTFDGKGIVTSVGEVKQTAGELKITDSSVSLSENSRWEIGEKLTVGSSSGVASLSTTDTSKILLTTGGRVLVLDPNSTLNLGSEDAIVGYNTSTKAESYIAVVVAGSQSHTMNISADQHFSYINILAGSNLDITVSNDAHLYLDNSYNAFQFGNESASMRIFDFQEGQIYVGNGDSARERIEQHVTLYDADKNFLGSATVVNGWISLVAVPEPAEWAMILGVLALGFAIYRRRK